MVRFAIAYAVTAVVFLGVDALWLSKVALSMYRRELGALLLDRPNLAVSGLFYLVFILGIVVLVVLPSSANGGWPTALGMGALLGLVAYGTYDLTNLATLKNWSPLVTLADLAWGTALTAVAAAAASFVLAKTGG